MQIIIPMTGYGVRFKVVGYERLKPFIEVNGHPMIEWIVKMFPGDKDKVIFICRKEHLDSLDYVRKELERIAPKARIISIDDDFKKQGPIRNVLRSSEFIRDDEPAIICYCDYYMHWDYEGFKEEAKKRNCDGAVPCYSGFHPNLIPEKNLYATCKIDEDENLIEIREKFSWEKDKRKSRHSPGMYYFKNGEILKKYCKEQMDADDNIKGEYYASVTYNYLVKAGLKVWCPVNVPYFCQWGTPEDLREYEYWIDKVKKFEEKK
jgi:NDP-sugar pyrophosphorylase family protein